MLGEAITNIVPTGKGQASHSNQKQQSPHHRQKRLQPASSTYHRRRRRLAVEAGGHTATAQHMEDKAPPRETTQTRGWESSARRRQTERMHARRHTRARASTHTNADSMSGTMTCTACTPAGKRQCQQQRHCARCRQRGHEYESHAKCAGAAADVTVVVRGRVVVVVVVVVVDVTVFRVVVVAAVPPALSAPRARHCRGRKNAVIFGRKNAAQADTGHVEGVVSGVASIADPAAVVAVDPTQSQQSSELQAPKYRHHQ